MEEEDGIGGVESRHASLRGQSILDWIWGQWVQAAGFRWLEYQTRL